MSDVIDGLIENVNDVTEDCAKNAHKIQDVIHVDRFNDITDDENLSLLRYIFKVSITVLTPLKIMKVLQ